MARGNPPKARGTAAERARRSGRWKIDTHRSYHSSPRLPVPKRKQFALCTFGGAPIWKSLFLTVTGIRQDSKYDELWCGGVSSWATATPQKYGEDSDKPHGNGPFPSGVQGCNSPNESLFQMQRLLQVRQSKFSSNCEQPKTSKSWWNVLIYKNLLRDRGWDCRTHSPEIGLYFTTLIPIPL